MVESVMQRLALSFSVAGLLLAGSVPASATPVNCPGTASTADREFTLNTTPGATCYAYDAGNINGAGDALNDLGWITLDKSDDNTTGALEGALTITGGPNKGKFFIDPIVWTLYSKVLIAFKSGQGQVDPDWAAFLLPTGVTWGKWEISQQGLSHANLYGMEGDLPLPAVPEPASLLLLGSGLAAAGWRSRRRRRGHN